MKTERALRTIVRISFVSALLAWVSVPVLPSAAEASTGDDLKRLREFSQAEDTAARRDICRAILQSGPAQFARAFCEGYEALLEGREQESDALLEEAMKAQSGFDLALILYADAYAQLNKPDKAEALYRRAIESSPQRADARFSLGALLLQRARENPQYYTAALEVFRRATELDASSPDGWSNMGLTLARMGRLTDAEQMYKKAIERAPEDPLLRDSLASCYAREDRTAEAEASWKDALRINPGYGPAIIELSALYARTDRVMQALGVLEAGREAVQAPPWGPRIRRNLGFAFLGLNETDNARARFQEATAIGDDALAFLGLGHVQMLAQDIAAGAASLERGAALDSAEAVPFVLAWEQVLRSGEALRSAPMVAALLAKARAADPLSGARGGEATGALVRFALEGWSFEKARADRATGTVEPAGGAYDTPPIPIEQVPADFPDSAQESGMHGQVQVVVTVGEDGRVTAARIQSCSAPPILCDSALKAAKRWTFKPATRYGAPVAASIMLPFRFSDGER